MLIAFTDGITKPDLATAILQPQPHFLISGSRVESNESTNINKVASKKHTGPWSNVTPASRYNHVLALCKGGSLDLGLCYLFKDANLGLFIRHWSRGGLLLLPVAQEKASSNAPPPVWSLLLVACHGQEVVAGK